MNNTDIAGSSKHYLFHLQSFGGFIIVDPTSIKQKPNREHLQLVLFLTWLDFLPEGGDGDPDPLSIGLLQFSHLSGLLDSEVDLIAVLANNLQLDVLGVFSHVDDWSGSWQYQYQSSKDGDLFPSGRHCQDGYNWTLENAGPESRKQLISRASARSLSPRPPYTVWSGISRLESSAGPRFWSNGKTVEFSTEM